LQPILLSAATPSATVFSQCFDFHLGVAITQPTPCSFSASLAGDNGNVYTVVNNLNNSRTQKFTYDALNRIATGASQATSGSYCWGQSYTIDAWANLYQIAPTQCSSGGLSQTATVKNQLTGFGYDAAGNMISNGSTSYVYDSEGRLQYLNNSGNKESYLYDGDGQRVAKCTSTGSSNTCAVGSTGTLYFRDLAGETYMEQDLSGNFQNEFIFFNGGRVARSDSGHAVHYYFHNHLTSTEVVTNALGATPPEQDVDYTPYGQIQDGTASEHYLFTGKERDSESGLDEFGARYYGSSLGRFMTPDWATAPTDVPYASFGNPQSLNLYSYVNNNPTTTRDPDGHETQDTLDPQAAQEAGQTIGDVIVGSAKGLWNALASTANAVNATFINGPSIAFTGHAAIADVPEAQYSNTTQAVAGTVAPLAVAAQGMIGEAGAATETTASRSGAAREGIYEGPDAKAPGRTYVGQSGDIPSRLSQHEAAGKFPSGTKVSTTEVTGGKTAREVAEHNRIQQLGGVRSQPGSQTSNIRNPIGKNRQDLLKKPD
jgi:RHS repeat-associated protein